MHSKRYKLRRGWIIHHQRKTNNAPTSFSVSQKKDTLRYKYQPASPTLTSSVATYHCPFSPICRPGIRVAGEVYQQLVWRLAPLMCSNRRGVVLCWETPWLAGLQQLCNSQGPLHDDCRVAVVFVLVGCVFSQD